MNVISLELKDQRLIKLERNVYSVKKIMLSNNDLEEIIDLYLRMVALAFGYPEDKVENGKQVL